jgi:hypothetical protein
MQEINNSSERNSQALIHNDVDTVNIDLRGPSYETPTDLKHAIIQEWLFGCYDAKTAVFWMRTFGLLTGPYRGDYHEVMSEVATFELGPVELPERLTAPIPSVSSSKPFQPVGERV